MGTSRDGWDMHQSQSIDHVPELPTLDPGLRLLERVETDGRSRSVTVLHALVLDHLLLNDGDVQWIDVRGHATANPLARLAPSTRLLDRIHVARAFTPHQHAQLVNDLVARVDDGTSLVVCPMFDHFYREECRDPDGQELFLRGLATIGRLAREYDMSVVMTRSIRDDFSHPLVEAAAECLSYEQTEFGPRFQGEAFETLVYPVSHGMIQTTLAFWQQVLQARLPLYEHAGPTQGTEVSANGSY